MTSENTDPDLSRTSLDDVRKLELRYSRTMRGEAKLAVVYVGGLVKVFRVDRFLVERLLWQLEDEQLEIGGSATAGPGEAHR